MVIVTEIENPEEKSAICEEILRDLPDWFGIEASLIEYVNQVQALPFFVAKDGDDPLGFVAIKRHGDHTAEIFVMGVLEKHHRQGIGRQLVAMCQLFCQQYHIEFLTVKTVALFYGGESYNKTRLFYQSLGFKHIEIFPQLWDEANPCMMMGKHIKAETYTTVDQFMTLHGLHTTPQTRYIDLVSEIGELGKEILTTTNYGKKDYWPTPNGIMEMGDCLFSIIALCHAMDIDLQMAIGEAMKKYKKRFAEKGAISS